MAEFKKNWLRPFLFYGNNTLSLIGGAFTSASAAILIGFWVVQIFGHAGSSNPYLGIIFDLFLPGIFVLGLILIPIGIWIRRKQLLAAGEIPYVYPEINLRDPIFRHGIEVVLIATFINFVILGTATYRGVSTMDKPSFCGQSCHVMAPQWAAYQVSPHSHVDCVQCHIGAGFNEFVRAKVNGTKQLIEVTFHTFPTPIEPPLSALRPARATCEQCHAPTHFVGEKMLVKRSFGDDAANSMTTTMLALHLGGVNSLSQRSGIHGHHLANYQYIATDATDQTILSVSEPNPDGTVTEFVSTDWKGGPVTGVKRSMDCMDCHNQASHAFQTPENALNLAMADGSPNPGLPFVHKIGLALLKATYSSQAEAEQKITAGLQDFYRSQYPDIYNGQRGAVDAAARSLVAIYKRNVFPDMKVTWGTYPDNIGHNDFPGCFRCHDGNHVSKDGKVISNDCSLCHNLITVDDPNPKQLSELGFQ